MEQVNIRQKLFDFLVKYWWVFLVLVVTLAFVINIPILKFAFWVVGILFFLMIFAPFIFQLFAPAIFLISSLGEHFIESKGQSAGKRYFFIPVALFAAVCFVTAQSILSIWVFVLSFLIWTSVIGFFLTFITIFLLGLAPLAILTAPFVVWYQLGFIDFLDVAVFFLITFFWYGFSKMVSPEDYWKSTPETYLGYSPHIFLLGALSSQVIALPLYQFGLNGLGDLASDTGGTIFLFFALISAFKWRAIKKKLSAEERESLYKPSVWIYIFGFILTNLLYVGFGQKFGAPTAILSWLNGFFFVALIIRFFMLFKRKKKKISQIESTI